MKILVYIVLILSFLISGCKRKRKINVEGTVADIYTGKAVPGITVKLHSQIGTGVSGGTTNDYETVTNADGKYYFENAVFSKPGNNGWIEIPRTNYEPVYSSVSDLDISGKEIKFIGKTKLTRNVEVICLSDLNLSLDLSSSITSASFSRKFIGNASLPDQFSTFYSAGAWPESQSLHRPDKLIGYSDGINIIKTEYHDAATNTQKIKYDTLISNGCGSVNNYTITLH